MHPLIMTSSLTDAWKSYGELIWSTSWNESGRVDLNELSVVNLMTVHRSGSSLFSQMTEFLSFGLMNWSLFERFHSKQRMCCLISKPAAVF
ncbi:hypothetical protein CEXT_191061 [Caerostris extrusa]|uniref:Uncharacterized protein n=1 Tax=Caerostris extrusa TaxID=172846 RepID=A0AAV4MER1_CAEEX|nr:hypothetical protein CEXT_191061 [Caerostris extrusa]